jgi:regulator of sigma E protease
MFIVDFIIFVLVLGVIILIHELGHFYFAKRAGILCHEFSIGMGPAVYQKRSGETIYSIRAIPIGGYVSMAGESVNDALIKKDMVIGININEQGQINQINLSSDLKSEAVGIVKSFDLYGKDFDPLFIEIETKDVVAQYPVVRNAVYRLNEKREMWITPSEKSFETKTLWQRFLVIFAGPFMNFILAIVLFTIVGFFVKQPNLESSEILGVSPDSPAVTAGLQSGDILTDINGEAIQSWYDLSAQMQSLNTGIISMSYQRSGTVYQVDDVVISVIIQMAGISNVQYDEDDQFVAIYNSEPMIGTVFGRAETDGLLKSGDVITNLEIDGGPSSAITSWDDVIVFFKSNTRGSLILSYERDGVSKDATYNLISQDALSRLGYQAIVFQIGITPTSDFNLGYTLAYPFKTFYSNMMQVFNTLGLLFDAKEDLGLGDLSGPVGIFTLVSSTASQGFLAIIGFTGFLSINIGLLNLMPIPALDGGRLVFLGIEAVTRKPLNRKIENTINNVMFFLLIGLFIFVTYNDILRLIKG